MACCHGAGIELWVRLWIGLHLAPAEQRCSGGGAAVDHLDNLTKALAVIAGDTHGGRTMAFGHPGHKVVLLSKSYQDLRTLKRWSGGP